MTTISPFQAAWNKRYADMPVITGRSALPPMDGDIAWLNHLEDVILGAAIPPMDVPLTDDHYYRATIDKTGINPHQLLNKHFWRDRAAELLADWRAGR